MAKFFGGAKRNTTGRRRISSPKPAKAPKVPKAPKAPKAAPKPRAAAAPANTEARAARQSFGSAFKAARAQHGPGHVFTYGGKPYTTYHAGEEKSQSRVVKGTSRLSRGFNVSKDYNVDIPKTPQRRKRKRKTSVRIWDTR